MATRQVYNGPQVVKIIAAILSGNQHIYSKYLGKSFRPKTIFGQKNVGPKIIFQKIIFGQNLLLDKEFKKAYTLCIIYD